MRQALLLRELDPAGLRPSGAAGRAPPGRRRRRASRYARRPSAARRGSRRPGRSPSGCRGRSGSRARCRRSGRSRAGRLWPAAGIESMTRSGRSLARDPHNGARCARRRRARSSRSRRRSLATSAWASSRPSGFARSRLTLPLPDHMLCCVSERSGCGFGSSKGGTWRMMSMRARLSTLMTSAPRNPSTWPTIGPAQTQPKFATRTPSRGRRPVAGGAASAGLAARAARAAAIAACVRRASSRISFVCSPSRGARRARPIRPFDGRNGRAEVRHRLAAVLAAVEPMKPRPTICGCFANSSTVMTAVDGEPAAWQRSMTSHLLRWRVHSSISG